MNKVIILGRLVKDNTLKYLPSGSAVCNNTIAVSEKYKTKSGEQKEDTTFLDITIFMGAETFNQYTHKGSKVLLEGSLKQNNYQDKNGQNRVQYFLKVDSFTFLDSKNSNQGQGNYNQPQQRNMQEPPQGGGEYIDNRGLRQNTIPDFDDDEVPFAPIGLQYPSLIHSI